MLGLIKNAQQNWTSTCVERIDIPDNIKQQFKEIHKLVLKHTTKKFSKRLYREVPNPHIRLNNDCNVENISIDIDTFSLMGPEYLYGVRWDEKDGWSESNFVSDVTVFNRSAKDSEILDLSNKINKMNKDIRELIEEVLAGKNKRYNDVVFPINKAYIDSKYIIGKHVDRLLDKADFSSVIDELNKIYDVRILSFTSIGVGVDSSGVSIGITANTKDYYDSELKWMKRDWKYLGIFTYDSKKKNFKFLDSQKITDIYSSSITAKKVLNKFNRLLNKYINVDLCNSYKGK